MGVDLKQTQNLEKKLVRVAILMGAPLTQQNYERVGIPYLSPYFEICVVDCMGLLKCNISENRFVKVEWSNYINITTENDLENAIKKFKPNYIIDFIGGGYSVDRDLITKTNAKTVTLQIEAYPIPGFISRIMNYLIGEGAMTNDKLTASVTIENQKNTDHRSINLVNNVLKKIKNKIHYHRYTIPYDIALLGGNKAGDRLTRSRSHVIEVGTVDYHKFHKIKDNLILSKTTPENYIVFIDDYLPSAHDFELLNINAPVSADNYYQILRDFFDKIESYYGLPVIVAGHPNAKLDASLSEKIGGRKIVFDETAILVIQSTLVLMHRSTAVAYAVLARKPILFMTSKELEKSYFGAGIKIKAKCLDSPIVVMDQPDTIEFSRYHNKINIKKYKLYETNYLRSHLSNETKPWEMFINFVTTNHD